MANDLTNIVRKISVEIKTPPKDNVFDFRQKLDHFMQHEFIKKLGALLDEYKTDEYIFIDKVSVDCDMDISDLQFNSIWLAVEREIRKQVTKQSKTTDTQNQEASITGLFVGEDGKMSYELAQSNHSKEQQFKTDKIFIDAFFFFLHEGYFPWWLQTMPVAHVRQQLIERIVKHFFYFLEQLSVEIESGDEIVLSRLVNYFNESEEEKIFSQINISLPALFALAQQELLKKFDQQSTSSDQIHPDQDNSKEKKSDKSRYQNVFIRKIFWMVVADRVNRGLLESGGEKQQLITEIKKYIEKIVLPEKFYDSAKSENDVNSTVSAIKREFKKPAFAEEEGGLFISNAGVVLLHPFIRFLFVHLELLDANGNIKQDMLSKAVHLLWYLLYGEELEFSEEQAVILKILCGIPVEEIVDSAVQLTKLEKDECDNMLNAVISHWQALKTTSPAGLRSGFLQRAGKLSLKEDSWFLQVEQKTMDVLIGKLPWSISIIKLPWMENWLKVEWA